MRVFEIPGYGQELRMAERPEPVVGASDVLVQVDAAGMNQLDEKIRIGEFKQVLPYRMPLVLGHDLAGTVLRVGPGVQDFRPGDQVFGRVRDGRIGTLSERIAVAASDLARRPQSLNQIAAATLPLVALTAWQALVERGGLQAGRQVLIHGGAGGVGALAVQLARHLGAHVTATAGSGDLERVRGYGADTVIDYRDEDFAARPQRFDLVLDSVGGQNLRRSLAVARSGGLVIGIAGPPDPAFARSKGLNPLLRVAIAGMSSSVRREASRRGVRYSFLFMSANGQQLRRIAEFVDDGVLRTTVGRAFAFDDAPEALDAVARGAVRGRVVVLGA